MRSSRTEQQLVMPILSSGRHRNPRRGACFMEFASYLAGEKWSDHPSCTHPVLAALARDVNDLASDATRATLTQHVHRVVGLSSNDPMVMAAIAIHAAARALPIASLERQRAIAVGMIVAVRSVDSPELEAVVAAAFLSVPEEEKWARRHIALVIPREFTPRTAVMIVHTAAAGIALACVPDVQTRLVELLVSSIEIAERLTRVSPAHPSTSEQGDAALRSEFAEV